MTASWTVPGGHMHPPVLSGTSGAISVHVRKVTMNLYDIYKLNGRPQMTNDTAHSY
jgi:hypothetical protein